MTYSYALTIHQPYASLIAHGHKRIETRGWYPPNGWTGELLIHAAKGNEEGSTKAAHAAFVAKCYSPPFIDCLITSGYGDPDQLPRASVVAVAQLARAAPMTEESIAELERTKPLERAFGNYAPGRFAWVLHDIRRLPEPIPARGAQKLWRPPAHVVVAVHDALRGVVA